MLAASYAAPACVECFPKRLFWGALLIATFAPFVLILAPASMGACLPGTTTLVLLTTAHVGSSAFFFSDTEFRPLIRANPIPFIIAPIGVIVLFGLFWYAVPPARVLVLMGYMVWQLHHYQRQSYGIVAFACRADGVRVPAQLTHAVTLTVVAGSLGIFFGHDEEALWPVAIAIYIVALAWIAAILVRNPEIRRSPTAFPATFGAAIFLLPSLIPTPNMIVTFWSFAIAHGAQYLIFMIAISGAAPRRYLGLACLLAAFVGVGLIAQPITKAFWLPINLGLVCSHFLIDAKVWKMRETPQRELIGRRFRTVLQPRATA